MTVASPILEAGHWDTQYRQPALLPWETGRPSRELRRVLSRFAIRPRRALELGCGTGINAVWLASCVRNVAAIDLSRRAIRQARRRAEAAGVRVRFVAGDLTEPGVVRGTFDFFFDRGCYHAVRLADREGYFRTLAQVTRPGSLGLVLAGNAGEPEDEVGPPVLHAGELLAEWEGLFEILRLRAFHFDAPRPADKRYLGWSCLVRRRPGT